METTCQYFHNLLCPKKAGFKKLAPTFILVLFSVSGLCIGNRMYTTLEKQLQTVGHSSKRCSFSLSHIKGIVAISSEKRHFMSSNRGIKACTFECAEGKVWENHPRKTDWRFRGMWLYLVFSYIFPGLSCDSIPNTNLK